MTIITMKVKTITVIINGFLVHPLSYWHCSQSFFSFLQWMIMMFGGFKASLSSQTAEPPHASDNLPACERNDAAARCRPYTTEAHAEPRSSTGNCVESGCNFQEPSMIQHSLAVRIIHASPHSVFNINL